MEKKKDMIWYNSMNYGGILGGILVVISLIGYVFHLQTSMALQMLNYLFMGGLLYYGTKVLRDKYDGGVMGYGRGLASGFLISLFAGIIVGFFVLIYFKWLDPSMLETMRADAEQKMIENGTPDKYIEQSLRYINGTIMAIGTIISFAFWGFLLSLLVGILVMKKPNPLDVVDTEENKDELED